MKIFIFAIFLITAWSAFAEEQEVFEGNPESQNTLDVEKIYIIAPDPEQPLPELQEPEQIEEPKSSEKTPVEIHDYLSNKEIIDSY